MKSLERAEDIEQPCTAEPGRRFGEGSFPEELGRRNWGATLAAPLWALAHGLWAWAAGLFAFRVIVAASVVQGLDSTWPQESLVRDFVTAVLISAAWWAIALYLGKRANRTAWAAESARIQKGTRQPPVLVSTVGKYCDSQREWVAWGFALIVLGLLFSAFESPDARPLAVFAGMAGYIFAGLIPLGVWLRERAS